MVHLKRINLNALYIIHSEIDVSVSPSFISMITGETYCLSRHLSGLVCESAFKVPDTGKKEMCKVRNAKDAPILLLSKYFMVCAGIWKLQLPTKNGVFCSVYGIYSAFVGIYFPLFVSSLCIQFVASIGTEKNLEDLFQQLSFIIIFSIAEVGALLCQSKDFKQILSSIVEEERQILMATDDEVSRYHATQIKFCNAINSMIIVFVLGTGTSIILENFWKRQQVEPYPNECNGSAQKPFIYELYLYKFDPYKYPNVMLSLNYFMLFINVLLIISTKVVFVSCIVFTSSSLRKLQVVFRKTSATSTSLVELIREHQRVTRFVGKLNDSIRYMILMEYLLNSISVAAASIQFIAFEQGFPISPLLYLVYLLVQIFALGWTTNEIQIQFESGFPISPFLCLVYLFVQTFVLGWSANEIQVQSLALGDALYDSPWHEQNDQAKRLILSMIMRSQRPLALTIGPFDTMTTASALRIMKASYSYVSLMIN
ncbi:uncharacterized protein LOC132706404 [Cylas formicarius]|uniref:uncharacterized protein LOC132706404 n=1 Tax=Cylas formicarius TaxID=197179 RepID=UPI0029587CF6|nr:uncharacterized protein LOC132706404 [Cylas formicarius]